MRWLVVLGVALATAASPVWQSAARAQYAARFRLTIEVQTPDGIKSASSVINTQCGESDWGTPESRGVHCKALGQAIFLDLGGGKNLVALLGWGPIASDGDRIYGLNRAALSPPGTNLDWKRGSELHGRGTLPPDYIPTLITFADISDPKTAHVIEPAKLSDTFGPGYVLRDAFLETTNDPVVFDIIKKLPWWGGPGRPAQLAYLAWRARLNTGQPFVPETRFLRE